jgi:hypothetical protein
MMKTVVSMNDFYAILITPLVRPFEDLTVAEDASLMLLPTQKYAPFSAGATWVLFQFQRNENRAH